jgi:cellobiose transport system substrate-binding protein
MRHARTARTALAALGAATLACATLAACGGGSGGGTGNSEADRYGTKAHPVTLTVNLFGDFGYKQLYKDYEKAHPYVTIKENEASYPTHHSNLQAHLVAGAGAGDVEAIDSGFTPQFVAEAGKFANMYDYGVDRDQWSPAKVAAASTANGKDLIGVGTDVGGLAICYRTDLLKAAGLPTDPETVGKTLWPDWPTYLASGQRFSKAEKTVKWFDGADNLFAAMVHQAKTGYYDTSGKVVVTTNPAVKQAWDTSVQAIKDGLSAGLQQNSQPWNTGFAKGSFATVICPAWQLANIQTAAASSAGKWSVAAAPGVKGNNGGSYLAVPKQSRHTAAAVALSKWLTAPTQEIRIFQTAGNFPSDVATWTDPQVAGFTKPFFSNAPIGQIYINALKGLPPQYQGPHAGDFQQDAGNALQRVEQGTDPDTSWQKYLQDVKPFMS